MKSQEIWRTNSDDLVGLTRLKKEEVEENRKKQVEKEEEEKNSKEGENVNDLLGKNGTNK